MTLSLAAKAIILYLCIGIVLTAGGVTNDLSSTLTDGSGSVSSGVASTLPNVNEETGAASGLLSFIDSLRAVRNFIVFFGTVSLALPGVLLDLALPEIIRLIVGVPLTIIMIIGIVQFGRSGQ